MGFPQRTIWAGPRHDGLTPQRSAFSPVLHASVWLDGVERDEGWCEKRCFAQNGGGEGALDRESPRRPGGAGGGAAAARRLAGVTPGLQMCEAQ